MRSFNKDDRKNIVNLCKEMVKFIQYVNKYKDLIHLSVMGLNEEELKVLVKVGKISKKSPFYKESDKNKEDE